MHTRIILLRLLYKTVITWLLGRELVGIELSDGSYEGTDLKLILLLDFKC